MGREKRPWHPDFIAYKEWAISHENYRGLPIESKRDGTPRWAEMGGTPIGRERQKWWDQTRLLFEELSKQRMKDMTEQMHRKRQATANR